MTLPIKKTFVWGGGSQLRVLLPFLERAGRAPDFVFDSYIDKINYSIDGLHFKDAELIDKYAKDCDAYLVAIGNNYGKERCNAAYVLRSKYSLVPLTLIHPTAYVCETSTIEEGVVMMPHSVINSYSQIGSNCIINTNASVDHECLLGNGVHVMGGAVIAGRVEVGNFATIGSNATILPDRKIGESAFVGAGAVVTRDVPDGQVVVGVPARLHCSLKLKR